MDMDSILQHLQTTPNMALALAFLLLFITILLSKLSKRYPYPPGPRGLPIIGNMNMMDQLQHRGLAELAKIYGGLTHLKMGRIHMVAVSTAEMAQQVLQAQDSVFSNRPATIAISYLTYDRADMAFAHYGPFWRQMRKICVTKVFSRKRAESWSSVREEIDSLIAEIGTKVGSPVNLGAMVLGLTKNITYRAAFGSISQEGQGEFVKIMQEFSKLFGAFNVADFLPWLGWIHGQDFNKRLAKARGDLDGFIDRIIDDHVAKRNARNNDDVDKCEDDMVDEMMEFYDENGEKGDSGTISMTRDNIKALIMDVMFGGTETVASAIEWAMAELMKSRADLKCVIKETLRLHPPIPLLLHETAADAIVAGYKIPAKSRVMINAWAIGRDESAWIEPHKFNPSRFTEIGAPDFKGGDFEYIPFGSGRRSCPGMQLGLYALELSVAHLCHSFDWELPNGMKADEIDMNDVFGLTAPKAVQLEAIPKKRIDCEI